MSDTCEHCGAPVVRTKRAIYDPTGSSTLLHRQSCTNPPKPTNTETLADVKRATR